MKESWRKHSSQWLFGVALIVFLLFLVLVLPAESAKSAIATGSNASPDLNFGYSPATLLDIAESYGEAGRAYYIASRLSFDIVWPLAYLFFLLAAANLLFSKPLGNRARTIAFALSGAAFLFDLLENQLVSHVMRIHPLASDLLLWSAGAATSLKWLTLTAAFLLLMAGLLNKIVLKRKAQTDGQADPKSL